MSLLSTQPVDVEPSSETRSPSTNTQPRSIQRSASRREHIARSDMILDSRTPSGGGPSRDPGVRATGAGRKTGAAFGDAGVLGAGPGV